MAHRPGLSAARTLLILNPASGRGVGRKLFQAIQAVLANQGSGPLPPNLVLAADEIAQINAAVASSAQIIAGQASAKGAPLMDINALLSSVKAHGLVVHGQRLTSDYLGGLFSLDGIHPTYTGHALIADKFIHALNSRLHAGIPPIALAPVAKTDPLALPGVGHPPSKMGRMDPEIGTSLRAVLTHR